MGKSSLVREYAQGLAASPECRVATAAGSRHERFLPFSVVRELRRGLEQQPAGYAGGQRAESSTAPPAAGEREAGGADGQALVGRMAQEFCDAVLEASWRTPVVLIVDDVHEADDQSLQCLAHLARRLAKAAVVLVLAGRPSKRAEYLRMRSELARSPWFRLLPLKPLAEGELRAIAAGCLGSAEPARAGAELSAATGGNPLLVAGLVADTLAAPAGEADGAQSAVGAEAFGEALVDCVHRLGIGAADLALRLAVLGPQDCAFLFAAGHAADADVGLQELEQVGLVEDGRLRHPHAYRVLPASTNPDRLAGFHRGAAELLYEHGADACAVARHVADAGGIDAPWAASLLNRAGADSFAAGRFEDAARFFGLARDGAGDEHERAGLLLRRINADWWVDPMRAQHRLFEFKDALLGAGLGGTELLSLFKKVYWNGWGEDARTVLNLLRGLEGGLDQDARDELACVRTWLLVMSPPLHAEVFAGDPVEDRAVPTPAAISTAPDLRAAEALVLALRGRASRDDLLGAEQILEMSGLTPSLEAAALSVMALIHGGRPDRAAAWCEKLLLEDDTRSIPVWDAVLSSFQTVVELQYSRFEEAEARCQAVFTRLSPRSLGVYAGVGLSSSVYALTMMGRYDAARSRLAHTVPEAMFDTIFGQHYLYARGRYYLATGSAQAALGDFTRCGDYLTAWEIDKGSGIPWRTFSAEALLGLGKQERALELLQAECVVHESDPRLSGNARRILAGTEPLAARRQILHEAVTQVQNAGARFELAQALGDLGRTYQQLGQNNRARLLVRQAYRLAKECHAQALCAELAPDAQAVGRVATLHRQFTDAARVLTRSEYRVAVLAAEGCSNREISKKLFVTVSTVEQHMTRVLRKLEAASRSEIPAALGLAVALEMEPPVGLDYSNSR